MSSNRPPTADDEPGGGSLWQILNAPDQADSTAAKPTPSRRESPPQQISHEPMPDGYESDAFVNPKTAAPSSEPEPGAAILQRILSAPEDLGEDFEYRPASAVDTSGDFDKALLYYYRDTGIAVHCRNHPEEPASGGQCPECTAYYCQECMVVRKGRFLCRDCASAMFVPDAEEVISAQERGLDTPENDVLPQAFPEFQVGNEMFGREGSPASPVKQLIALLLDFVLLRAIEIGLLFLASVFFQTYPAKIFHLFTPEDGQTVVQTVIQAALLMRPIVPWLIFFAVVDYLYFFLCLSTANRTIGMSWTGCRVVTEWGDFVSYSAVAVRTLVFMVCLGFPAILIGWVFPAFRGPHDYAAGTLVINYAGVKRVDVYETVQIKL
jgi:uncharacterized RDD family membrane protein YckC